MNKHAGQNNHAGRKSLQNLINVQVEKFLRIALKRLHKCGDGMKTVLVAS